jgi:hypothetical protein
MDGLTTRCWMVSQEGNRWEVGPRGLLIGRSPAADIHLSEPTVSRRAALVYMDPQGIQLVRIGQGPVEINGQPLEESSRLTQGDRVTLPGSELRVEAEELRAEATTGWALRYRASAGSGPQPLRFEPLPPAPFIVGGGEEADLLMHGWPELAVLLEPALPGGWRARLADGVTLNGRVPPRNVDPLLQTGDELGWQGVILRLMDMTAAQETTMSPDAPEAVWQVELQPVPPAGGQITIKIGHRSRTIWLPGLRFDLVQVLLVPVGSTEAGDPVPDSTVLSRVWGRLSPKDPKAVNTLVKRLRKDLEAGGLDAKAVIERAHGRTRFVLAEGAVVTLEEPR